MIIIDTSIWISLMDLDDPNMEKARSIVGKIYYEDLEIFDHVYAEVLTVLRNKISNQKCHEFKEFLKQADIEITFTDAEIFEQANHCFFKFPKLSFTDCLLLASAKITESQLMTFDKNLQKAWKQSLN